MRSSRSLTTLKPIGPLLLALVLSARVVGSGAAPDERQGAELWQKPDNLEQRNLFYGPGGTANAPDPNDAFTVVSADDKGFSPGFKVRDARGRMWNVKLGPEARTEVVVSRLVWAVGYHQPDVYYLPRWRAIQNGKATTQPQARFRLESGPIEDVGHWSWRDNPFVGSRPLQGLFVLMVMVNNWDIKTQQNGIYRVRTERGEPRHLYAIKDLGASLGGTNWIVPGDRDNLAAFEKERFIRRVEGNRVEFYFQGAWHEPHLASGVSPDDVRWISDLLARLTPRQWSDAFRAGGYAEPEAARFIQKLRGKIAEGQNIG
jgi:hypothetical protein